MTEIITRPAMHKIEKHLEWGKIMEEGSSLEVQAVFIQHCQRTKKKKKKKKAESR